MAKVTKDTLIGEALQIDMEKVVPILMDMGMHCIGCPASQGESIAEACAVHGIEPEEIVDRINKALGE